MNYEELKMKVYNKLSFDENNFLVFDKIKKILITSEETSETNENFIKLAKQLSYDYLVKKRREYQREDLKDGDYQCENPANFPEENSPLDKIKHIDCLTAWNEDWEILNCSNIAFQYLKNLNTNIMILLKDATGKNNYYEYAKKLQPYPKALSDYINKTDDENPFEFNRDDPNKRYLNAQEWRYGIGVNVPTNLNLRDLCNKYLNQELSSTISGKIDPVKNENIFLTNSFVFLSAEDHSPSHVPDKLFEKSVNEFIVPLIDTIRPKCVIQGGLDSLISTHETINNLIENNIKLKEQNQNNMDIRKKVFSSLKKRLEFVHSSLQNDKDLRQVLFHINWDKKNTTLFFPSYHPSMIFRAQIKESDQKSYYVWPYIAKYI